MCSAPHYRVLTIYPPSSNLTDPGLRDRLLLLKVFYGLECRIGNHGRFTRPALLKTGWDLRSGFKGKYDASIKRIDLLLGRFQQTLELTHYGLFT